MKKIALLVVALAVALTSTGCFVKDYLPTRIAREFLGEQTSVHVIVPVKTDLRKYKVLAVKKLDNGMLDEIPDSMYNYLNQQIVKAVSKQKLIKEVVPIEDETTLEPPESAPPTLILEGSLDNYHPGSRGLRLVEVGLNHAAVTIRFQLRDWKTNEVIGSASVAVYEQASSKTVASAVKKASKVTADLIEKEKGKKGQN